MQGLIINIALNLIQTLQKNISLVLTIFTTTIFSSHATQASEKPILPLVAITQIVQHGALDDEFKGIVTALEEAGYIDGKTIHLVSQNAQGNIATAGLIATNFASRNPNAVVAISTPSAQTLIKPLQDQHIPLIFTAVTDPKEARLVSTLDERLEEVTGVSDALLPGPQLDLIQKFVPQVKTIGIIYNSGEINSIKTIEGLKEEAKRRGLTLLLAVADKSSEVIPAVTKLIGKVESIYVPNDNTAVASIESIVTLGKKFKVPIFAGDSGSVERGAVASQAYERIALGKEAGRLVVKILEGQKAGDLKIKTNHPLVLMLNLNSAKEMGMTIPEELKKEAKIVGEKS